MVNPPSARPASKVAIAYFLFFSAMGCWAPFIGVYYRQMHPTGLQLGMLFVIPTVCTALFGPVWGWVTDRLGGHRTALRLMAIPAALAALAVAQAGSFAQLWPRVIFFGLTLAPMGPLMDGIALSVTQRSAVSFGRVRMWGSIGYIAVSALMGLWLGGVVTNRFLYVQAALFLVLAAMTLLLPAIRDRSTLSKERMDVRLVLANRPLRLLLLTQLVLALANTAVLNYVGVFMDSLGATPRLIGLAVGLMAVSEVPILAASSWFTRRFSAQRLLLASITFYVLRFALLSQVRAPEWVLPVQLINGVCYGLYALSAPRLAHELAGGETFAATAQGLLASAAAIGGIAGTLLAGVLLDAIEIHQIFLVMSGVMSLAWLIFALGWRSVAQVDP